MPLYVYIYIYYIYTLYMCFTYMNTDLLDPYPL